MKERIDNETPEIIRKLCGFPYEYFGKMFGDKNETIIDVGSGWNPFTYNLLKTLFKKVFLFDKEKLNEEIIVGDIRNIPILKDEIDNVFCFEVIEHLDEKDQQLVVKELCRIAKKRVIIGSINKTAPNEIEGVEIYKAEKNPFHKHELDIIEFPELNKLLHCGVDKKCFHSEYKDGKFTMENGLKFDGYCNYMLLRKC